MGWLRVGVRAAAAPGCRAAAAVRVRIRVKARVRARVSACVPSSCSGACCGARSRMAATVSARRPDAKAAPG